MTQDRELAEALERVRPLLGEMKTAALVRELALRGAESVLEYEERRAESMQKLIEWSTTRTGPFDWDLLDQIDELAWGYKPEPEE